jgi:SSS family solute:Na+ symporter
MTSALAAATKVERSDKTPWMTLISLGIGAALASRGQGIVATMVSVNVIYIASIAWPFICLLAGRTLTPPQALAVVATGFASASMVYAASWLGKPFNDSDFVSLVAGLTASGFLIAGFWLRGTVRRIPT